MKDVNKVILVGRLGADPIERSTQLGKAVVNFSLATTKKFRKEGDPKTATLSEDTQWHRIVAWGTQARNCSKYLKKGHRVYVEGSLKTRTYQGKDGETYYSFEIHAREVNFLGSSKSEMRIEEKIA